MWQCYIVHFPSTWPHTIIHALLPPSLTSSRSLPNPLSHDDTASLAVGGTTVTFYRCKPFVCSLARYSYNPRPVPLSYRTPTCVIDRAHTLTHTHTRLENGKHRCARMGWTHGVHGTTPSLRAPCFFFFFFAPFGFDFGELFFFFWRYFLVNWWLMR